MRDKVKVLEEELRMRDQLLKVRQRVDELEMEVSLFHYEFLKALGNMLRTFIVHFSNSSVMLLHQLLSFNMTLPRLITTLPSKVKCKDALLLKREEREMQTQAEAKKRASSGEVPLCHNSPPSCP